MNTHNPPMETGILADVELYTDAEIFSDPGRFMNRELSWLEFNRRVLQESRSLKNPLLERLRFLSISVSNLDEFFMVRVAGLTAQLHQNVDTRSVDGLTPLEQLEAIGETVIELQHNQQDCLSAMVENLAEENINIVSPDAVEPSKLNWLEDYYTTRVFPLLTPLSMDLALPFPFIPNRGHALIFDLKRIEDNKQMTAFIRLPEAVQRFIPLPERNEDQIDLVAIDQLIEHFIDRLFPGFEVRGFGNFRVIRDSDLEIEEEAEDLVLTFETALKRRRRGSVIRLEFDKGLPEGLRNFVSSALEIDPAQTVLIDDLLLLTNLPEIVEIERKDLKFVPFAPRFPEAVRQHDGDCFQAIGEKDLLLHHPYESFDVVVQFLAQAARDPDVVAIKQTLYRTSNDSPIVAALIEAAEAGKSVMALIELKARFDEEANIRWARDLERAGVQVVFGFVGWKTHSKLSMVVRREDGVFRSYVHIGTGNYHPVTARVYTDLSFFSAKPAIAHEVAQVFNFITGFAEPPKLETLAVSPIALRAKLIELIENEVAHAKAGRKGHIWGKMNAIVDPDIIDAFYRASQAGVKIELVVRGICCLRPCVQGMSENITVKSIVGRFLEHSRILCFGNGRSLPADKSVIYMGSADLMPRNLDRRIETMVRLDDADIRDKVLNQIMKANFLDNQQSWEILPNGSSRQISPNKEAESFNAQECLMSNPAGKLANRKASEI